jgi:hypothetical protein
MFKTLDITQTIGENEKKTKELEIKMETLGREEEEFLKTLKVTPEQLTVYIENEDNFSREDWTSLLQERKKLDEKLQRELENIRDPQKLQKAYSERIIDNRWLYIK